MSAYDTPRKVTVSFTRKINLGNYESAEFSALISGTCEEDQDVNDLAAELTARVKAIVYEGIAEEAQEANHQSPIVRRFLMGKEVLDSLDNF